MGGRVSVANEGLVSVCFGWKAGRCIGIAAHCSPATVSTINTFCKSIFVTAMKNSCLALHHLIDNK